MNFYYVVIVCPDEYFNVLNSIKTCLERYEPDLNTPDYLNGQTVTNVLKNPNENELKFDAVEQKYLGGTEYYFNFGAMVALGSMVDTDKDTLNEDERLGTIKNWFSVRKAKSLCRAFKLSMDMQYTHCSMTSESGDGDAVSPFNKLLNNYEIHNVTLKKSIKLKHELELATVEDRSAYGYYRELYQICDNIKKEWNLNRDKTLGYSQDGNLTINLNSKCSQILQLKVLLSCNIVYLILLIYRSDIRDKLYGPRLDSELRAALKSLYYFSKSKIGIGSFSDADKALIKKIKEMGDEFMARINDKNISGLINDLFDKLSTGPSSPFPAWCKNGKDGNGDVPNYKHIITKTIDLHLITNMNTIIDRLLKVDLDSDIKDNLQASFSTDINDRLDSVKVGIVTEFAAAQKVAAAAEQAATAEDQAVGTGQDVVDLGPDADPTMSDSDLESVEAAADLAEVLVKVWWILAPVLRRR